MSLVEINGQVVASGVAVIRDNDAVQKKYVVFESIGDGWEQHSVWLDHRAAINMLEGARTMYPDRIFHLMMKVDS